MIVKTIRISSKGQVTLPIEVLRAIGARKGTELILVQEGDQILLASGEKVGRKLIDDLGGWESLAAPAFAEVWDNPADEIWNEA